MLEKLASIQNSTHHEHLNSMRKRVNVLIGELNDLINRYEGELNKLQPQLNGKARRIIECITSKENNEHIKGKELAELLSKKDVYESQPEIERLVEKMKGLMEEKVQKLEDVMIGSTLNDKKVEVPELEDVMIGSTPNAKSVEEHLSKGNELYDSGKYKEALEEFILVRQSSLLKSLYVFRIGSCYHQLNDK